MVRLRFNDWLHAFLFFDNSKVILNEVTNMFTCSLKCIHTQVKVKVLFFFLILITTSAWFFILILYYLIDSVGLDKFTFKDIFDWSIKRRHWDQLLTNKWKQWRKIEWNLLDALLVIHQRGLPASVVNI